MPTGYTHKLMDEGQTFEQFAKGCARAFGGFIHMRDEPMDAPLRLPEANEESSYYQTAIEEKEAELKKLLSFSEEQKVEYGEKRIANRIESLKNTLEKEKKENARLSEMLGFVKEWEPPTPEHGEFKAFMISQLNISFHTGDYYERELAKTETKSAIEVYEEQLEHVRDSIEYNKKKIEEQSSRVDDRCEWAKQLIDSIESFKK